MITILRAITCARNGDRIYNTVYKQVSCSYRLVFSTVQTYSPRSRAYRESDFVNRSLLDIGEIDDINHVVVCEIEGVDSHESIQILSGLSGKKNACNRREREALDRGERVSHSSRRIKHNYLLLLLSTDGAMVLKRLQRLLPSGLICNWPQKNKWFFYTNIIWN